FSSTLTPPPRSTLFPYTTLFRSHVRQARGDPRAAHRGRLRQARRRPAPGLLLRPVGDVQQQPVGTRGGGVTAGAEAARQAFIRDSAASASRRPSAMPTSGRRG